MPRVKKARLSIPRKGVRHGSLMSHLIRGIERQCKRIKADPGESIVEVARVKDAVYRPVIHEDGLLYANKLPKRPENWNWRLFEIPRGSTVKFIDKDTKEVVVIVSNMPEEMRVALKNYGPTVAKALFAAGKHLKSARSEGGAADLGQSSVEWALQCGEAHVWGPSANPGQCKVAPTNQKVKPTKWNKTPEGKRWWKRVYPLAKVHDDVLKRLAPDLYKRHVKIMKRQPKELRYATTAFQVFEVSRRRIVEQHVDDTNEDETYTGISFFSDKPRGPGGGGQVYVEHGIIIRTVPGLIVLSPFQSWEHAVLPVDTPLEVRGNKRRGKGEVSLEEKLKLPTQLKKKMNGKESGAPKTWEHGKASVGFSAETLMKERERAGQKTEKEVKKGKIGKNTKERKTAGGKNEKKIGVVKIEMAERNAFISFLGKKMCDPKLAFSGRRRPRRK